MTINLDLLNSKIKTEFDNYTFNLNKEEYELCKKYYGNVMATSNGVAYIKIAINDISDINYLDKLEVGDMYNAHNELFSISSNVVPYSVNHLIDNKEHHDIVKTLVSPKHMNKSISLSPLGYVLLGVKYKPENVVYSAYANTKYNNTNSDYIQPPKHIDDYIVLNGEVKIVANKRASGFDKSSFIDNIVNSFSSLESLKDKSNSFARMLNIIEDKFLDDTLIHEIKHRIFKNVVKNEKDLEKFLTEDYAFLSFNDVKDLKIVDDYIQKGLSYDFKGSDDHVYGTENRLTFYYNGLSLSKFVNSWQILDYIVTTKFFIIAGMDYLNNVSMIEISQDDIIGSHYMSRLDGIYRYSYVIDYLLQYHKKDISISKIKKSNGYKNVKMYVNAFDSLISSVNIDFENFSDKKISFEDFYNKHNKTIDKIISFVDGNDSVIPYVKFGNSKLYKKFANYIYHIYPPAGIIDTDEKRKLLNAKQKYIRGIFKFLENVAKYEYWNTALKV